MANLRFAFICKFTFPLFGEDLLILDPLDCVDVANGLLAFVRDSLLLCDILPLTFLLKEISLFFEEDDTDVAVVGGARRVNGALTFSAVDETDI